MVFIEMNTDAQPDMNGLHNINGSLSHCKRPRDYEFLNVRAINCQLHLLLWLELRWQ